MNAPSAETLQPRYNVVTPARHTLHECSTAEEFRTRLEATTRWSIQDIADRVVSDAAPKAVFTVGSVPLGMGTSGSDIDLIVLVDSRASLLKSDGLVANTDQRLEFSNEKDSILAAHSLTIREGVLVDLQIVLTPAIREVYSRLRRRGPELTETEIQTLGRLSTGWLLWQSEGYLQRSQLSFRDPAFAVYCCTKNFVLSLLQRSKASRALEYQDIPLMLQHGRHSIEMAYLAYFASEGMPYLGSKWLAQLGHARGAAERLSRHPLLKEGIPLLFPSLTSSVAETTHYLGNVTEFLTAVRELIERQVLFKIAFKACPQIDRA